MRPVVLLFVSALVGAGCGDDVELPPPAPLSCADLAAQAIERPDIGECLVTGRGFWVAGVSYAASDGHDTWTDTIPGSSACWSATASRA